MNHWLVLCVALVLNAGANLLIKIGANTARPLPVDASFMAGVGNFLNATTIAAIVLFAANVLTYRKALEGLNLSVAYPVMVSGGLILVTLAAALLPMLREKITLVQIAGMLLIGVGVWLVART